MIHFGLSRHWIVTLGGVGFISYYKELSFFESFKDTFLYYYVYFLSFEWY